MSFLTRYRLLSGALFATLCLCLNSCDWCCCSPETSEEETAEETPTPPNALVWIESTTQMYNAYQPWDSMAPEKRYAYGVFVEEDMVLTVASVVEFASYIQLSTSDEEEKTEAQLVAVDYELNLALLKVSDTAFTERFDTVSLGKDLLKPEDEISFLSFNEKDDLESEPATFDEYTTTSQLVPGIKALSCRFEGKLNEEAWQLGMPALQDGALMGLLTYYNSGEQESITTSLSITRFFLDRVADESYEQIPTVGLMTSPILDDPLREWLHLPESLDGGGRYVSKIIAGGAADASGLQLGDVIVELDGLALSKEGKVEHPTYGEISWAAVFKDGSSRLGETVPMKVYRNGELLELELPLNRDSIQARRIPLVEPGTHTSYKVYGGFIFRELDLRYFNIFGNDWRKRAPIKLLSALNKQEQFASDIEGLAVLSFSLQTPATIGYETTRHCIVERVNGERVLGFNHFVQLLNTAAKSNKLIRLDIDHETPFIILDPATCERVNRELQNRGLKQLERL